jgi:hypothetical protein
LITRFLGRELWAGGAGFGFISSDRKTNIWDYIGLLKLGTLGGWFHTSIFEKITLDININMLILIR